MSFLAGGHRHRRLQMCRVVCVRGCDLQRYVCHDRILSDAREPFLPPQIPFSVPQYLVHKVFSHMSLGTGSNTCPGSRTGMDLFTQVGSHINVPQYLLYSHVPTLLTHRYRTSGCTTADWPNRWCATGKCGIKCETVTLETRNPEPYNCPTPYTLHPTSATLDCRR